MKLAHILKSRVFRIAVVAAVVIVPAVVVVSQFGRASTALDRTLSEIGFYPLSPPSLLVVPGSIYHVSRDGRHYWTICKADEADTKPYIVSSPSQEMIARELQKAKYSLGANSVNHINASLEGDVVESANYALSKVSVLEISGERSREIFMRLTKREACQREIDELLKNREFVCQAQSVLLANVEYQLESKARAGGKAKLTPEKASAFKAALQTSIDSSVDFSNGRFTSGTELYYGVRVNPYCISRPTDRAARRLPNNSFDRVMDFVQLDVLGW